MLGSFCILLNLLLIMLNHKTTLFISKISKKALSKTVCRKYKNIIFPMKTNNNDCIKAHKMLLYK